MVTKICITCKKCFEIIPARARNNRGKYCSLECRRKDSKTIMAECIICHRPQKRYRSTLHKHATLCSKICESKWKSSRTNFYTDEYRKEHRVECRCKQCGKLTVVAKANKFVFCDKKCYSGYMTKGEYRACKTCGKEFWGIRSYIERGWDTFCSKACARQAAVMFFHSQILEDDAILNMWSCHFKLKELKRKSTTRSYDDEN